MYRMDVPAPRQGMLYCDMGIPIIALPREAFDPGYCGGGSKAAESSREQRDGLAGSPIRLPQLTEVAMLGIPKSREAQLHDNYG